MQLLNDDCLKAMTQLSDNSVDTIITDPPYGLGFMNKEWDSPDKQRKLIQREKERSSQRKKDGKSPTDAPFSQSMPPGLPIGGAKEGLWFQEWTKQWALEALRVAKPGATMLVFGAPRQFHRMTVGIEDAGWQIRDCIMWVYGSGFPKSLNIGKAIDKLQGDKRTPCGTRHRNVKPYDDENNDWNSNNTKGDFTYTKGTSDWEGYGTALKPAHEPILVAMKPLDGTFAQNAKKWGVGGLNIDGARIGLKGIEEHKTPAKWKKGMYGGGWYGGKSGTTRYSEQGRFPANFIHDGSQGVMDLFPNTKSGAMNSIAKSSQYNTYGKMYERKVTNQASEGSAARFFYCAKASKAERNRGCKELPKQAMSELDKIGGSKCGMKTGSGNDRDNTYHNNHPTVKPLKLMEYLCILTRTPTGGIVLDPFMGSGTTGMACVNTGRDFIGIEKEKEYFEIAKRRINDTKNNRSQ